MKQGEMADSIREGAGRKGTNQGLETPGTSRKIYSQAAEGPSIQIKQFQSPFFSYINLYSLSMSIELNSLNIQNRMVTSVTISLEKFLS